MSRLNDELRNAFRREQPSSDFAARVLERVAKQPAPRRTWLQRLASLLDPPKLRWVAIGVTASLLLAIGAAQYSKMKRVVTNEGATIAEATHPSEESTKSVASPANEGVQPVVIKPPPQNSHNKGVVAVSKNPRRTHAQAQKDRELRAEAEAAAEKLMLALSIASTALNDAQKAVHDDGLKP